MVYNQERSFAVARLREAARECGVRKKLLKPKGTASRGKVAEAWDRVVGRKKRRGVGLGLRVGGGPFGVFLIKGAKAPPGAMSS